MKPSKKTLKKMQKDAEKDRKKRMQDPFYLGGAAKADSDTPVLLDEEEVETIPVFRCGTHRFMSVSFSCFVMRQRLASFPAFK